MTALSIALAFLGLLAFVGYYLTLRERRPKPLADLVLECKAAAEAAHAVAEEAKAAAAKSTADSADVRKDMNAFALAAGLMRVKPKPEDLMKD